MYVNTKSPTFSQSHIQNNLLIPLSLHICIGSKTLTPLPKLYRFTGAPTFLPLILAKMTEETKEDKRVFSFLSNERNASEYQD